MTYRQNRTSQWSKLPSNETKSHNFIAFIRGPAATLHILAADGKPLPVTPIEGVKDFHLSNRLIAYRLKKNNELHVLTNEGQPLKNFQPVKDVYGLGKFEEVSGGSFAVSDHLIAYLKDGELHVLDANGVPVPNFLPVENVSIVKGSSEFIAYIYGDKDELQVLDSKGTKSFQALREGVSRFGLEISDELITYQHYENDFVYLSSARGKSLPDFEPIEGVFEIQISNTLVGYRLKSKELHLLDIRGRPLSKFKPIKNVDRFWISDQLVAYQLNESNVLYVLGTLGLPPHDFKPIPGVGFFKIFNNLIVYIELSSGKLTWPVF